MTQSLLLRDWLNAGLIGGIRWVAVAVAVAAPPGWATSDTERIRRSLERLIAIGGPELL